VNRNRTTAPDPKKAAARLGGVSDLHIAAMERMTESQMDKLDDDGPAYDIG
jgi:hypothetical protein